MIIDSKIMFMEPVLYVPMDDRNLDTPNEIINGADVIVSGDTEFEVVNGLLGDMILLYPESTMSLAYSPFLDEESYSMSFWFSIRTLGQGVVSSYETSIGTVSIIIDDNYNLVLDVNGSVQSSSVVTNINDNHQIFITRSPASSSVWVNTEEFFTGEVGVPGPGAVVFGGEGTSPELRIGQVSAFDRKIGSQDIIDSYNIGSSGRASRTIDSEGSLSLTFNKFNYLQTNWESYGTITTKE